MHSLIQHKKILDFNISNLQEPSYSGIPLIANSEILMFLNFSFEKGEFDGFTILRNQDFNSYTEWDTEDYHELKNDNSTEWINSIDSTNFSNLKNALSHLEGEIIAVLDEDDSKSYYEGKVISCSEKTVEIKLIDTDYKWSNNKSFILNSIRSIGFRTQYEQTISELVLETPLEWKSFIDIINSPPNLNKNLQKSIKRHKDVIG